VLLGRRAAAVLLVSVLACVVAAPTVVASATPRHESDGVFTKATVHRATSGLRDLRTSPLVPALLVAAVAAGVVHERARRLSLALVADRRRISDDGDDWRALLLGAPPASS